MKFRKKPVVIEAVQFNGSFLGLSLPDWIKEALNNYVLFYYTNNTSCELYVKTLEGNMRVDVGDYIIKGVKGELYPCKPDIFELTYEVVDEMEETK